MAAVRVTTLPPKLRPNRQYTCHLTSTKTSEVFTPPPSSAIRRHATTTSRREHEMVGLSVILENYKDLSAEKSPQVISKGSMIKPPSSSPTSPLSPSTKATYDSWFLDHCFLCKQKLLPGKDIYMYKGDKGFCSVECRCRQIFMDEEESKLTAAKKVCTSREYNSSLSAMKGPRNRSNAFAY
ncbi:hypothetical protein CDL12_15343 [Handroanthus impetiginosus]|uniref:FLZ-type domain-containing protein n=1 Tax=Handroanthus impetiginosus TaxID=429701 RepID=A0A2G9H3E7_9LAMI|nr:hypothetical protein CDL12_15343 [Handroanthus impetiginosus]